MHQRMHNLKNMEYTVDRSCKDCKNIDKFGLSKNEAAFQLYDKDKIWTSECSACGSINCKSISLKPPKYDKELLDLWGHDGQLFFMEQDEGLLLAEVEYFPMILNAIDKSEYLKGKIGILVESICILLYDNTAHSEEYSDEENMKRNEIADMVRSELIKRKAVISDNGDFVMDYIKEGVFPQIGLETEKK